MFLLCVFLHYVNLKVNWNDYAFKGSKSHLSFFGYIWYYFTINIESSFQGLNILVLYICPSFIVYINKYAVHSFCPNLLFDNRKLFSVYFETDNLEKETHFVLPNLPFTSHYCRWETRPPSLVPGLELRGLGKQSCHAHFGLCGSKCWAHPQVQNLERRFT